MNSERIVLYNLTIATLQSVNVRNTDKHLALFLFIRTFVDLGYVEEQFNILLVHLDLFITLFVTIQFWI